MMKRSINIGLCGLGTVGTGVLKQLNENASLIRDRVGADLKITRAVTVDPYDHILSDLSGVKVSDSVNDVLEDPEIDIVVEMIGGVTIAKDLILEVFKKRKSVVTANKALLAEHSSQIFEAAYKSNCFLGFEASVGGGIPIIRSIREGFSGDRIDEISGIVNGTANYILSSMTNEGVDFQKALKEAQEKGYAEADPTYDIEGIDAAHKILLLMELAYNSLFDFKQLYIEGISKIESIDIEIAREYNYVIKLLGKTQKTEKGYEGRVHPVMVNSDSMLASVQGAFNAITVCGNFVGETMSYGAGAGSFPTASAVVGDIIQISRRLVDGDLAPVPPLSVGIEKLELKEILPIDEIETEYYLRLSVKDSQNSIAEIRDQLSKNQVHVRVFDQKAMEDKNDGELLVIFTKKSAEKNIQTAISSINKLPDVVQPAKLIRVDT
jgi:homoserine dehydrogenase